MSEQSAEGVWLCPDCWEKHDPWYHFDFEAAYAEYEVWRDARNDGVDSGWHDCDCGPVGGGWPHPTSAHNDGPEGVR